MSAVPLLMVLYDNDAVEVRYSDETSLELSPCGSAFLHQEAPHANQHPLQGKQVMQQRSQFATSHYRSKVIEAVDFRNRFAERPFICADLLNPEEVVMLYSSVASIAWRKSSDDTNMENLPDGNIRLVSDDNFASLILSSHRKDFTICYLSKLSESSHHQKKFKVRTKLKKECIDNTPAVNVGTTIADNNTAFRQNLNDISGNITPPTTETGRPYSQPNEEPIVTPYGKTAIFRDYHYRDDDTSDSQSSTNSQDSVCTTDELVSRTAINPASCDHEIKASEGTQSKCRSSCTWFTRHMSCNECPSPWQHPMKLCQKALSSRVIAEDSTKCVKNDVTSTINYPKKVDVDSCMLSTVPRPLPLSCPGQHLHKWRTRDLDQVSVDDVGSQGHGHLKVILAEGVIYRIVRLPSLSIMEVYPGDGSILVSQGVSGHIFTHTMFIEGKLQDLTYSVKSPPPDGTSAKYSIGKMIKRAFRFLTQSIQDEKHMKPTSEQNCCWKYENIIVSRPASTTILEECVVPGQGKFTALTNGQVRVVFSDRTALDMVCDFSERLSFKESNPGIRDRKPTDIPAGMCRLMLPNGHYHTVDLQTPGQYVRYVEVAAEWAKWVNTPPTSRRQFYADNATEQMSVAKELQKIHCFNYIVENTVLKQNMTEGGKENAETHHPGQKDVHAGVTVPHGATASHNSQITEGFLHVQEALLKTSNLIHDIDNMLKKS